MKLSGNLVALVTPMTNSGDICYEDIDKLIDFHLDNNTSGLVVLGTTGEAATLSNQEKESIVKRVVNRVNKAEKQIPIIVGSGDNSTVSTIEQTNLVKEWGADAALIVTPYYNKPTQEGLYEHYTSVAKNTDIDIILYNVPGRTGVDMQPDIVARLSKELDRVVAIKEAVPADHTNNRIQELKSMCSDDFVLLSGDDETFLNFIMKGGRGVVSVASNIIPKEVSEICSLLNAKKSDLNLDLQKANSINDKYEILYKNMFICSNPIPVKWSLFILGLISTPMCRLPLLPLEKHYQSIVLNTLAQLGFNTIVKAV